MKATYQNRRSLAAIFLLLLALACAVCIAEQGDVGYDPPAPGSDDTGFILIDKQRNNARKIFTERIDRAVSEYAEWSKESRLAVLTQTLDTLDRHARKCRKELEAIR